MYVPFAVLSAQNHHLWAQYYVHVSRFEHADLSDKDMGFARTRSNPFPYWTTQRKFPHKRFVTKLKKILINTRQKHGAEVPKNLNQ